MKTWFNSHGLKVTFRKKKKVESIKMYSSYMTSQIIQYYSQIPTWRHPLVNFNFFYEYEKKLRSKLTTIITNMNVNTQMY